MSAELFFVAGLYTSLSFVLSTYKHPNSSYVALDYCKSEPSTNLSNRGNLDNANDVRGMLHLNSASVTTFVNVRNVMEMRYLDGTAIHFDRAWSLYHEQGWATAFFD